MTANRLSSKLPDSLLHT